MESYKEQQFIKQSYKKFKKLSLKKWDWLLEISSHLRSNHLKSKYNKKRFCSPYKNAKSIMKWTEITKSSGIKDYKRISEKRFLSSVNESGSLKEIYKIFDGARIEKTKKNLMN